MNKWFYFIFMSLLFDMLELMHFKESMNKKYEQISKIFLYSDFGILDFTVFALIFFIFCNPNFLQIHLDGLLLPFW